MDLFGRDTHPDVERMLREHYRAMPGEEKLRKVVELNRSALAMARARIRAERPGIGDDELRLRVAALWLPRDLMIRAFGWDPDSHA